MEDPSERCLPKHPSHGACRGDPCWAYSNGTYTSNFGANYTITNPSATSPGVTTTLGRPIATPGGITFPLLSPTAQGEWSDRVNQVDFR